jgi:hypothetical protein
MLSGQVSISVAAHATLSIDALPFQPDAACYPPALPLGAILQALLGLCSGGIRERSSNETVRAS